MSKAEYIYVYMYVCVHVRTCIYTCTYIYIYIYIFFFFFLLSLTYVADLVVIVIVVCVYIYMYMYVYVYVYVIYIYIYMYIYVKEMLEKIERQNDVKIEAIHRKLDIKEEIESKEQDPERNDQRDLSGMEIMFLTIGVRFIVQTLDLAYAPTSNKSTRARIFLRVVIAVALFGFVYSVVSITIKIRTNSKKWANYVLDLAIFF